MQESLYQTADAGVSISDSGCKRLYIRQRMQETLYHRVDARDTLSDSGRMRLYQTADADCSISVMGCKRLNHTADAEDYQTADARDS